MSENTASNGDERIVSVTEKGQATIPKQLREKHGIQAPGRVKFVENEEGRSSSALSGRWVSFTDWTVTPTRIAQRRLSCAKNANGMRSDWTS
ncbi:AbrB/MazE/SpoVT family DNA-binding domain-containing protein [Natronoarchaeum sp. GCM10025703]|uniref:AbrB/MazE/SpoVT family DNA-binding domain-containing protein n=1 Tax=Natronoarchaeum sp. GCM10025703 TaxID=3252685 RepID=UPI003611890B